MSRPSDLQLAQLREAKPARPGPRAGPRCQRCGFEVSSKPWGCKNPCGNCGTVYPLGDCSD